jgi:hypothetical protein
MPRFLDFGPPLSSRHSARNDSSIKRHLALSLSKAFFMRRLFLGGIVLLSCGTIVARSKTDSLMFVFLGVDHEQDVAILRPMIAPDIGVQLDSGPRNLERGTVLRCEATVRAHDALVESQISKVTEIVLDCGDHKFIVKTLDFTPPGK